MTSATKVWMWVGLEEDEEMVASRELFTLARSDSLRPRSTTLAALASTKAFATAAPMPLLAPVITTVLPETECSDLSGEMAS